jgi:hypothetical protein
MSSDRENEFCKAFSGLLVTSASIQLLLELSPDDSALKEALALTQKASSILDRWSERLSTEAKHGRA